MELHLPEGMTKPTLFKENAKTVRDSLNRAVELSEKIHALEDELIALLREIDRKRYYVRYGFNSLRGFCVRDLRFSKTQGQRIVTRVRRPLTLPDDG